MTARQIIAVGLAGFWGIAAGCGKPAPSFTLPAGSPEIGAIEFQKFRCHDCHRVRGVALPPGEETERVSVELGIVSQPRSYTDLVTGIINPSHRLAKGYAPALISQDGKSRMPIYNDVMTVRQLTDIVAFLAAHTEVDTQESTAYPNYYP